jgi:hypothetical protein
MDSYAGMKNRRGSWGLTMNRIWLCLGLLIASTVSAYAAVVPEIDAFSGLAAMGVIGSIVALLWERRRSK